jgi:hypothetical protein
MTTGEKAPQATSVNAAQFRVFKAFDQAPKLTQVGAQRMLRLTALDAQVLRPSLYAC